MKAYAALFEDEKTEASYTGYARVEFDYVDSLFLKPVGLSFCPAQEENPAGGTWGPYNWIVIFDKPEGEKVLCSTCISDTALKPMRHEKVLCLLFCNLPEKLSKVTRETYHAVIKGEVRAEDIPPKIYEEVNNELHTAGIPVIPCKRSGAAKWKGSINTMPSVSSIMASLQADARK
jgi:hypothetical protein